MTKPQSHTLREFTVPIPLHCHHCEKPFPKASQVDVQKPYVVVLCPNCGCMTPFKIEATA